MRFLAFFLAFAWAGENNFISDSWWETKVTEKDFVRFMSQWQNSFDDGMTMRFYGVAKYYGINPIVFAAKCQVESSAICRNISDDAMSRVMGYGIMDKANWGFDKQIWSAGKLLYEAYQGFRPNAGMTIIAQRHPWDKTIKYHHPENRATWAIYVYTPVWGGMSEYDNKGVEYKCGGNVVFEEVNIDFKSRYEAFK